jgi:phosphatidylserine synthase
VARLESVRAFAVHIFTACGAALALMALIFATGEHWAAMFFCLGLALLVDGVDGPLAREFKVAEILPRWSGDTLDLIVDFTTYVFVPAYAIAASGLLPPALAIPSGIVVAITGALYFADRQMKTPDNYFRGFPAVWNLAAFYLYLLEPPEWLAAGLIAALAVLTAGGALLAGGSLAAHLGEYRAMYASLAPGIVGGALLILVQLAYVPNAVLRSDTAVFSDLPLHFAGQTAKGAQEACPPSTRAFCMMSPP